MSKNNNYPDWISCEQELPKKSGQYLVQIADGGSITDLHFSTRHQKWNARDYFPDTPHAMEVDAWMELPPRYKKGEKK